ncbi:hypothetical protein D3C81_1754360 [compost metagenome]
MKILYILIGRGYSFYGYCGVFRSVLCRYIASDHWGDAIHTLGISQCQRLLVSQRGGRSAAHNVNRQLVGSERIKGFGDLGSRSLPDGYKRNY